MLTRIEYSHGPYLSTLTRALREVDIWEILEVLRQLHRGENNAAIQRVTSSAPSFWHARFTPWLCHKTPCGVTPYAISADSREFYDFAGVLQSLC